MNPEFENTILELGEGVGTLGEEGATAAVQ